MGEAKRRKAEIDALKIETSQVDPKAFIEECKSVAAKHGWKDGYTYPVSDFKKFKTEIRDLVAARGINPLRISNAFPNMGTFTYTDGIVDYVLGAVNPLSYLLDNLPEGIVCISTGIVKE